MNTTHPDIWLLHQATRVARIAPWLPPPFRGHAWALHAEIAARAREVAAMRLDLHRATRSLDELVADAQEDANAAERDTALRGAMALADLDRIVSAHASKGTS